MIFDMQAIYALRNLGPRPERLMMANLAVLRLLRSRPRSKSRNSGQYRNLQRLI